MKIPKDMEHGTVHKSISYGYFEIFNYVMWNCVYVRFISTGSIKRTTASAIRNGYVKDLFMPNVYGVGFIGEGKHKSKINGKDTIKYKTWSSMLKRCYSEKSLKEKPTYKGCTVCDEWHNFQNFGDWFDENYRAGLQLDKDILSGSKVGKIYSPDFCLFVSCDENIEHSQAGSYTLKSPCGNIVKIFNMSKFCREHDLGQGQMSSVVNGMQKSHKGWTKYD